jgi:hypothetical protein
METPGIQQGQKESQDNPVTSRWALLRDVSVFQAKLLMDGFRDLVLLPVSLVVALIGLVSDPSDPGRLFRRVMDFGRRSDRWINLFGDPRHFRGDSAEASDEPGVDELVGMLEQRLLEHYRKGGVTATAKDAVDRALDAVHKVSARQREAGADLASEDPGPRPDR